MTFKAIGFIPCTLMEKGKYEFINEDKRILDRNLRRHQISKQDFLKLLKSLPDERERAEELVVYSGSEETRSDS